MCQGTILTGGGLYSDSVRTQRFGSVNEFRTDANSSYAGLQTSYTQQLGGLTLRGNYTLSNCLDEVSNGGLLSFSTQGILSPLPGELSRQYGNCDYDVRHNISAFGLYRVPFHSTHAVLRQVFGGWSFSGTAFFHTGLPFTVLSQPYTANGNGIFQASRPQFGYRVVALIANHRRSSIFLNLNSTHRSRLWGTIYSLGSLFSELYR
jgi:hypothetical protein